MKGPRPHLLLKLFLVRRLVPVRRLLFVLLLPRLLFLLRLPLLPFLFLLQLLRLLLVPLLYLLLSRVIGFLLCHSLVFPVLLLLELLSFLFLFRELLFLLLLVLLILLRVPCIWRAGTFSRGKVARMDRRVGSRRIVVWTVIRTRSRCVVARLILATAGWGSVRPTWRFGRYNGAVFQYSRLRRGRDRRLAHVDGSP